MCLYHKGFFYYGQFWTHLLVSPKCLSLCVCVTSVCDLCLLQMMYLFLHTVKGTPFETPDQGKARLLTHWEQMDYGVQFTSSRKFLTISPIVL